jgi:hypothetical protein
LSRCKSRNQVNFPSATSIRSGSVLAVTKCESHLLLDFSALLINAHLPEVGPPKVRMKAFSRDLELITGETGLDGKESLKTDVDRALKRTSS